jgi:hypothetical protein
MPDKFTNLYDFIDFAKANRKYADNSANNLKSSLKIFEKELNKEELKSISMVEDSIGEIFRSVVIANKDKSIISLNTYKARLLKVIKDYKKYGAEPSKIQHWIVKTKKSLPAGRQAHQELIKNDKPDKNKINLSNSINTPVENLHKITLSFDCGKVEIIIPKNINKRDAKITKDVIDSLIIDK